MVRAKFRCDRIVTTKEEWPRSAGTTTIVHMSPVQGKDGEYGENERFHSATPSGALTMQVDNPAALEQFKPGQMYYLDFVPAPE